MKTHNSIFSPFKIGPLHLPNRLIRSAAFEGMCQNHSPSQQLIDYLRSVAAGGIGMTTVAYASVTRDGLSFPHQLWIRKEIIKDLRKLTDAVHHEGAAISVQLGHCGNMSKKSIAGRTPLSPSGGLNIYSPTWSKKMSKHEIQELADAFGRAVTHAAEAGFDAVEIHAGHGYLISQFLSPYTNKRKDEFGGTLENRTRFMKMVIEKVLSVVRSNMAVLVKINMNDGFEAGMQTDECLQVAQMLENSGVHALVLSGGFVSKAPMYILRGSMPIKSLTYYMENVFLKTSIRLIGKKMIPSVPFKETYFLDDAMIFRGKLKLPLVYVGGIVSGEKIKLVLNKGFEFVAMARALINEPDFANRIKINSNYRSKCICSNYCIARMYSKEMACHQHIENLPEILKKEIAKHTIQNEQQ